MYIKKENQVKMNKKESLHTHRPKKKKMCINNFPSLMIGCRDHSSEIYPYVKSHLTPTGKGALLHSTHNYTHNLRAIHNHQLESYKLYLIYYSTLNI